MMKKLNEYLAEEVDKLVNEIFEKYAIEERLSEKLNSTAEGQVMGKLLSGTIAQKGWLKMNARNLAYSLALNYPEEMIEFLDSLSDRIDSILMEILDIEKIEK